MIKRLLCTLLMLVMLATPASAQLNLTYTSFQPGQTISAAQFTANFTAISSNALNRTGGTMTGTFTANAAVDINSTFTIGSGNVQPFDSTGKIQAISSTYFASLNGSALTNLTGANITGVPETSISDGSLLARVGSTETITGAWTFSTAPTLAGTNITSIPETAITDGSVLARIAANESVSGLWTFSGNQLSLTGTGPQFIIQDTNGGSDAKYWRWIADSNVLQLNTVNDAFSVAGSTPISITRSGNGTSSVALAGTSIALTGNTAVTGTLSVSGAFSPSTIALSAGTVSAPAITFGDADTGIYAPSATQVAIGANSVAYLTVGSIIYSSTSIYPVVDGNGGLGGNLNRWNVVYATNGTIQTSDLRQKRDIKTTALGIEFIDSLKPVEYFWRDGKFKGKQYGFIAQDLQKLGFEGVDQSNPNMLGLRYTELIAPIVKGLQEVHVEVHKLDQQNKMLQAEIAILVDEIKALKKGYGGRMKAD